MSDQMNAYALLRSLGSYLETDIEVSRGTIERKPRHGEKREVIQVEGHIIRVTVSNDAPTEPKWPAVVFTGVGLAVESMKYGDRNFWGNQSAERYRGHLKVDLANAPQNGSTISTIDRLRLDSDPFPDMTGDERKHGYYLFPGQSIKYEISLSLKECPDVSEMKFYVEGTISRRHLFHYVKELRLSSG